jgi:decaprenylphospho-beta-D-ribofuranose 2-oxidase
MPQRLLTGWGRTAPTGAQLLSPADADAMADALGAAPARGAIPRGLGRSYGDAAQNAGGHVLDTTRLRSIGAIDAAHGRVTAGAGVSLHRLLAALVPAGWFLPVVPGTRHVTIGGAIAADVHGKNHHHDGSFGRHVRSAVLRAPNGERVVLAPDATPDELWATAGGMGLTGVVTEATVALIPIETSWIAQTARRTADLDETMREMAAHDHAYRYSVAWVDALARGRRLGRSVVLWGEHATVDELPAHRRADPLARRDGGAVATVPPLPARAVRRAAVAAFNELYVRRATPTPARRIVPLDRFFFPLDAIGGWNRLYGPGGMLQYQVVVPFGREDVLRTALELLDRARAPAFLAVLKRFGAEQGPLSFPMPGWTLALDLPAGAASPAPVLDRLDALVAEAGGRVYLAKDSRLRPDVLEAMYPRLAGWRRTRDVLDPDGVMRSDLARRLPNLTGRG